MVEGGVSEVGTEMTGVQGVVVIVENVCSEGVNVGHASAMMITIKEVEQIVVQRVVEVSVWRLPRGFQGLGDLELAHDVREVGIK